MSALCQFIVVKKEKVSFLYHPYTVQKPTARLEQPKMGERI